jgi:hypothetical protein
VLSYFNLVVTAGPQQGFHQPGTRSYAYRLDDETFTEVWGILEDDDTPPRMFTWRRIKEVK